MVLNQSVNDQSVLSLLFILNIFTLALGESTNNNTLVVNLPNNDSGTRILTLGYGTFIILCGFMCSGCICFFSRSTGKQDLFIPIILIIIFSSAPKEAQRAEREQKAFVKNEQIIYEWLYFGIILITIALCFWKRFEYYVWIDRVTQKATNWRTDKQNKTKKIEQDAKEAQQQQDEDNQKLLEQQNQGRANLADWTRGVDPKIPKADEVPQFDFNKRRN